MEEEQTKDFKDYLIAFRKRKAAISIIFVVILTLATSVAFLLPAIYKSSSTILIEKQEIPRELVMSTVTSYASQAIQTIQARVMTRTNLLEIIDEFELYKDVRKFETTGEIIDRMRDNVELSLVSADVVDPNTGRPSIATIAFSLSFTGESPKAVQRVANQLTTLYLSENITSRTQKADDASEFFDEGLKRLASQIDILEDKIAKFKEEHADALPELQGLNMSVLQRKEAELIGIDSRLIVLNDKSEYLHTELAQLEPGNPDIPGSVERLKILLSSYASTRTRYSEEHPDVVRLKNEIESLENETGKANYADEIAGRLKYFNGELAQVSEKYTSEHPDIVELKNKINELNIQLVEIQNTPDADYFLEKPDNPVYISVKLQLTGVDSEILSSKLQRQNIIEKIEKVEMALYNAPQVEREYLVLKRDYANTISRYQETKAKLMSAEVSKQLESESKGERFTLIEPATFPEKPISPNRGAILFLGFVLAVACGLGFALVADVISGSVRGAKNIYGLLGALPLAVIPYEINLQEEMKTKRIKKRVVILFVAVIVVAVLVIHLVIAPLDVLWFRFLRKIDILTV